MKKLLLPALCALSSFVSAQGVWVNQASTIYSYDFSASAGTPGYSSGSTASSAFLPVPPSGLAKVMLPANSNSQFTFSGTGTATKMIAKASTTADYSKFSLYKNTTTSAVTSIIVTLKLNAGTNTGNVFFVFGNTSDDAADETNIYNDPTLFSTYYDNGQSIFGGLSFDIYGGDSPAWAYRRGRTGPDGSGSDVTPRFIEVAYDGSFNSQTGTPLTKDIDNTFEFYCNNSPSPADYVRNSVTYTVLPGAYHLWVNNNQKSYQISAGVPQYNFPASTENTTNTSINSVGIFTANSSSDLQLSVGKIEMAYVPASTLPVKLLSFDAVTLKNKVQLNWATASEKDNSYFEVLRSANPTDFKVIDKVAGNNTTNTPQNYQYIDKNPLAGTSYYQLRQIDLDGTIHQYSKTVVVKTLDNPTEITVLGSSSGIIKMSIYTAVVKNSTVTITDMNGRKLSQGNFELKEGYNDIELPVNGISKGVYVATLITGNQRQSVKFLK
ncbi:T9SS type A sorting domain-containing protein [Pedobacter sp. BS3]|uniref:T9SS type A sorting domain-containing protein n=1 Tax=Pedobacter sp. BS3 TaxID=2567937 RepID=UPI0011ECC9D9|nr:T9SS type A sorting domain-containing protein [Pedobacter sp. BS3]TZF81516.1 T9SS type A sorting domain-containing protein [Pedobacter sp. BS3]